jgi:mannose-6-phosphate isomerase-like protein (cupin superfamily)
MSEALPSNTLRPEDIAARKSGGLISRQMLKGATRTGYPIDLHESELAAGDAPQPSHHHAHEELLLIREGLLEVSIGGRKTRLGPGSAAYLASNPDHGWRNVGDAPAGYFVLAPGDDKV